MTQSEAQLEADLIAQLGAQGYATITIPDEAALLGNLRAELGAHNDTIFSDDEFARILNHLNKGNVFERAKTLRDRFHLVRDDGTSRHITFLNQHEWCRNRFQVTHQITQDGRRTNRYDVTILINGLPLVHIELKRRGMEIAEAFNQINRYHRDSFGSGHGLFLYVQIFVISNGVNTKYYANQRKQSVMQTFFWAKPDNEIISDLAQFAAVFLEKCHIAKMICRHIVLHETGRVLMVLRPYQTYAVEAIVDRVKDSRKHGYIWHTTGSGKTLTIYKAAQIVAAMPDVEKVLFVVDRADLDDQTMREFNAYQEDSVNGSNSTAKLVQHFANPDSRLVVTTIQKLNNAITHARHDAVMRGFTDRRIVLIFDECHRSQFGKTHQQIIKHFTRAQMFGFTGTPIFRANAAMGLAGPTGDSVMRRTTEDLFGECLHNYVITNAIRDKNVLKFAVDYWGRLKHKDGSLIDDEQVAGINRREFFEDPDRIYKIVDWIIANHGRKTHNKAFSAILAVSSIDALCIYYDRLWALKIEGQHNLKIATVFSAPANEADPEADGHDPTIEPESIAPAPENTVARDRLDGYIADYNAEFGTAFNTRDQGGFYGYYRDIGRRIKKQDSEGFNPKDRIDILLVVSMYLTGFDAKKLNTIYVDKNLRHHGLIQAFSRTNRIFNPQKSQGNVVCFRNLSKATDAALKLFANGAAPTDVLLAPYDEYVTRFNAETIDMLAIAPTLASIDRLVDENDQLAFIKTFRLIIRTMNILKSFADFTWSDLEIPEQQFEDYKSKYLDLHDAVKQTQEDEAKASILQDVDFELDLIRRDHINVRYILQLLADALKRDTAPTDAKRATTRKDVMAMLEREVQLRSKRELIEKFISEYWDAMPVGADVGAAFDYFWAAERHNHLAALCETEQLEESGVEGLIEQFRFSHQLPIGEDIIRTMMTKPKILERRKRVTSASRKIMDMIEIFEDA